MAVEHAGPHGLMAQEVRRFHEEGYLGPFRAFTEAEIAELRTGVEAVLASRAPNGKGDHNRHLDQPVVRELVSAPAIVERMKAILGPDLLLWRTHFFAKDPGGTEIPWHQDTNYWPIEPPTVVSAWLAIDPATAENSCVRLIPSSHRELVPHITAREEVSFREEADPNYFDPSRAINMELEPGEFFLFTERTLHQSEPNRSDKRRIGLSMRVIPPITCVLDYDGPDHGVMALAGSDSLGFNRPATLSQP